MGEEKKTVPAVTASGDGKGKQISDQTVGDPSCDSTTRGCRPQDIVDLLPVGAENAMSKQTLVALCGYSSVRQLQEKVALAVLEGQQRMDGEELAEA